MKSQAQALEAMIQSYNAGESDDMILYRMKQEGFALAPIGTTPVAISHDVAALLVRALILFNDKPRFGPRNRRLAVDSYAVAADISNTLKAAGWNWQDPTLQPPTI